MAERKFRVTGAEPKELEFTQLPAAGPNTIYQAVVTDKTAPESPEYALAVSIATVVYDVEPEKFLALLGKMRVAFTLLPTTAPQRDTGDYGDDDDDDDYDDDEPLDDGLIQIKASVVSIASSNPPGVNVTVITAVGPQDSVGPHNNNHYWLAQNGYNDAWVTSVGGDGQAWIPKQKAKSVNYGKPSTHLKGKRVTVASNGGMIYTFDGSFFGPYQ